MEEIKFKSCTNKNCPNQNPQPITNFSKNKNENDGHAYYCKTCHTRDNKDRKKLKRDFWRFDDDDKLITIACLYVNGRSIKTLASLFNLEEDFIVQVLEYEELFEYIHCHDCGRLKHYSEYAKHTKQKATMTRCRICNAKNKKEPVNFSGYFEKINKYEKVRDDGQNILEAKCNYCGQWFKPNRSQIEHRICAMNDTLGGKRKSITENRLYCSDNCKNVCPLFRKMTKTLMREDAVRAGYLISKELTREVQPELRQMVFARDNYTCTKCNTHKDNLCKGLHCHHIEGIRWNPLESADIDHCLTVCETCHVEIHKQPDCGYHDMQCDVEQMQEAA
jgi:hypothetical protein